MRIVRAFLVAFVAMALAALAVTAQPFTRADYAHSSFDIPMRDGVKLHLDIHAPKASPTPLPFLFVRTPYGADANGNSLNGAYRDLAEEGYIFVFQDIRGRYKSEGTFVMQRAPRAVDGPRNAIDESTDAYDTIEWLLRSIPRNSGRVGTLGVSYPGWTAAMAMLDPHPALKAASPQASPADMWIGDDFHHNGAFRLSYGFEYAWMTESSKENANFAFDTYDTYDWYLRVGPLANIQKNVLKERTLPTWTDFAEHPNYDEFWQRQAMRPYLTRVTVPTLNVGGWWDQEDFYGPLTIYRELEKHDARSNNFLVVGPWNHGGWNRANGQTLGRINFTSNTSEHFRKNIQAPFFAHYLKDKGAPTTAEAMVFESGSNTWRTFTAWPPKEAKTRALYFAADGKLTFTPPTVVNSPTRNSPTETLVSRLSTHDSFISDPARPVPYRNRPIEPTYYPRGSGWSVWLLEDQRFVENRPDVLAWTTDVLTEDLVLAGDVTAKLFVSTTGQDADFVAKLIDVYPEEYAPDPKMGGFRLMVSNDVTRARFRNSRETPEPMVPGRVTPVAIDLHTQSYRFLKGHRVMVQVQSTWFPIIDRNPQTWVPNIFEAKETDFTAQTHRVWRTRDAASRVEIQTVTP